MTPINQFRFLTLFLVTTAILAPRVQADTSIYTRRPNASSSNGENLGLGLMLGEPSGLTAKYWLTSTTAFDVGLMYSFSNYMIVSSDYLIHFPNAFRSAHSGDIANDFLPYIGLGGMLFVNNTSGNYFFSGANNSSAAFAARIPLGIEMLPKSAPVGLFVELDPGIGIVPNTFGYIGGEIGGRFYF